MFQGATSPLWFELLKATFGPVTAAVVFIVGLLWRDRIERRNAAQAWFEQTYITEGLVLRTTHDGRVASGFASSNQEMSIGLGHHDGRNESGMAGKPKRTLLPIWKKVSGNFC